MDLRKAITRTITFTEVTTTLEGETYNYVVQGETTPAKEMKKYLRDNKEVQALPVIVCHTVTEKRAISIEDFISNSIIIEETEQIFDPNC